MEELNTNEEKQKFMTYLAELQRKLNDSEKNPIQEEKDADSSGYRSIYNIDEYQQKIEQFVIYPREHAYNYLALGLASEAGEVAGVVKKVIRDNDGWFSDEAKLALLKELGDVIWYVSTLASEIGVDMSEILAENYYKLEFRASRGMLGGSGDNR